MAYSPEVLWPNVLGLSNVQGSAWYQLTQNNPYFSFKQVITVDLSDINFTDNHDESTAVVKDILTFSNGVKIRFKFWFEYTTLYDQAILGLHYCAYWINNLGLEYQTFCSEVNTTGAMFNANEDIYTSTEALVQYYGVKIAIINDYTSSGVAVEGITKLNALFLYVFSPSQCTMAPSVNRSWHNVVNGAVLKEDSENGGLYYPEIAPNSSLNTIIGKQSIAFPNGDALAAIISNGGDDVDFDDISNISEDGDPTQDVDPSTPGGGDGDYTGGGLTGYDNNSDAIDFPDLPSGGALSTGSIKGFVVNEAIIQQLFNELWNTSIIDISTWQKLTENPLDSLISLHVLPFVPSTSSNGAIHLGNFDFEGGITAPVIDNQYITIDAGSITVKPYWGSALDFSPYTKMSIFLPFIGIRDLKPEDVINLTLTVKYNIDVLTGDLVAFIKCGKSVLYKYNGNCRGDIPATSKIYEGIANIFKGLATVGGGAVAAGSMANPALAIGGSILLAGLTTSMSKTHISRSGSITGVPGLLDDFEPYFIIHRPVQSLAKNFRTYRGYPTNVTYTLSSLSGYTEVEHIHLTGVNATDTELNEIERLLKKGVII